MKEIKGDDEYYDETEILEKYLKLSDEEAEIGKKIKDDYSDLDKKLAAEYKTLTTEEIKDLVVNDKWMKTIEKDVKTEVERVSQPLTQRIKELAERYETPIPKMNNIVIDLERKVDEHLQKMGFKW